MARLKGGKLLYDVDNYGFDEDYFFPLTDEEIDAIYTKGLTLRCIDANEKIVVVELIIHSITSDGISFGTITNNDGQQVSININLEEKKLLFKIL